MDQPEAEAILIRKLWSVSRMDTAAISATLKIPEHQVAREVRKMLDERVANRAEPA